MKKILLFIFFTCLTSCEEVVNVNLSTAEPKLVVDATINWNKGTTGNVQTIKLTTTTGYYQSEIPKVSGAIVFIKNSSNQVFNFTEDINSSGNSGQYKCVDFIPQLNETYTLTVSYGGQSYSATEKLLPSPVITDVEQRDDLGFNSDEIGLKINFNDFPNQINHYLTRFDSAFHPFPEYQTIPDEFTEGKNMAALYSNEKLKKGDVINISLMGISKTFYNYMTIVLSNANPSGPFQAPPAKIRGNIVNQTDKNNYALGYFRLGEVEKLEYSVE
ncbi:DUF4249 domain-containing protein [Flavobacterium sp. NG2]|uniref:DUF4249 domain-containing protein n=1 Tax=Flavobacterium sp. NG2 TaxID=3097547 RepID=UPI002A82C33E|nr:DUF4249 domain-containing protein [Flavobacterium sp. NG2]WPR70368.1 DUF4249 domain-containing protein [Flavobacterium sp. NG2]